MKCLAPHRLFLTLRSALLLALAGALSLSAHAQSRFCLGGDLQHLSTAQRSSCTAKLAQVRSAAQRFGAPDGWHFVMVCGEENWKAYAPFSTRSPQELERASADTDLLAHTTYVRELKLEPSGALSSSESVLARVVAATVLQTTDEAAIQAKVNSWLGSPARPGASGPVLQASR